MIETKSGRIRVADYVEYNRIGKGKVGGALRDLNIEVNFELDGNHYSRTISKPDALQLNAHLKILSPEQKNALIEEGCCPSNLAHNLFDISPRTFLRLLNELYPDWKETCFGFTEEHNRIAMIPSEYLADIRALVDLRPEREKLAEWRSLRKRK